MTETTETTETPETTETEAPSRKVTSLDLRAVLARTSPNDPEYAKIQRAYLGLVHMEDARRGIKRKIYTEADGSTWVPGLPLSRTAPTKADVHLVENSRFDGGYTLINPQTKRHTRDKATGRIRRMTKSEKKAARRLRMKGIQAARSEQG